MAMATYHIVEGPPSLGKRIRNSLEFTFLWLLGFSMLERFAKGHWIPPFVLAETGAVCLLLGIFVSSLWPREGPDFRLEVDDDEIRMVRRRKVIRKVRRDHIRYAGEWGGGAFRKLVVSERGPAATRLLRSGIEVPASLMDYEEIRSQAFSWLKTSAGR
jgi:hypothetical protein